MDGGKMAQNLKREIENGAKDLVERIREYSRSQVELWQQVPLLALEADVRDRSDHTNAYTRMYNYGYLLLEGSKVDGDYRVCVDFATGELVDPAPALYVSALGSKPEPARDEYVLKLAFGLKELDAQNLVSKLQKIAQEPITSQQEQVREERKQELQLTERYQRRK